MFFEVVEESQNPNWPLSKKQKWKWSKSLLVASFWIPCIHIWVTSNHSYLCCRRQSFGWSVSVELLSVEVLFLRENENGRNHFPVGVVHHLPQTPNKQTPIRIIFPSLKMFFDRRLAAENFYQLQQARLSPIATTGNLYSWDSQPVTSFHLKQLTKSRFLSWVNSRPWQLTSLWPWHNRQLF